MPIGRGKAKAKAKGQAKATAARTPAHNQCRDRRRAAVRMLNTYAEEAGALPIAAKTATGEEVECLVRVLQRRMTTDDQAARLRATAETWLRNGGRFSVPLEDALERRRPSAREGVRHGRVPRAFHARSTRVPRAFHCKTQHVPRILREKPPLPFLIAPDSWNALVFTVERAWNARGTRAERAWNATGGFRLQTRAKFFWIL